MDYERLNLQYNLQTLHIQAHYHYCKEIDRLRRLISPPCRKPSFSAISHFANKLRRVFKVIPPIKNISQSRYNRASRVVEGGTEYIMRYCHKKDGIEFYICTCPSWTARSTAGMDLAVCPSLERAPKLYQRLQRILAMFQ